MEAICNIWNEVKTIPSEDKGLILPSGRYAHIWKAMTNYGGRQKHVRAEVYPTKPNNPRRTDMTCKACLEFYFENGNVACYAMVKDRKGDIEFNDNVLRDFSKKYLRQ